MNFPTLGLLTCTTLTLTLAVSAAVAKDNRERLPEPELPKLSIVDVAEIAQEKQKGTIFSIHLDYFEDMPAYVVDIEDGAALASLLIDGSSGYVIAQTVATGISPTAVDFLVETSAFNAADLYFDETDLLEEAIIEQILERHASEEK